MGRDLRESGGRPAQAIAISEWPNDLTSEGQTGPNFFISLNCHFR
jgi:hypothetical protein